MKVRLIWLVLLCVFVTSVTAFDNITNYYSFDGTANDLVGSIDGDTITSVLSTSFFKLGLGAWNFTNATGTSSMLVDDWGTQDNFSMDFWVYVTEGDNTFYIHDSPTAAWDFMIYNTGTDLKLKLGHSTGFVCDNNCSFFDSFNTSQWYHVGISIGSNQDSNNVLTWVNDDLTATYSKGEGVSLNHAAYSPHFGYNGSGFQDFYLDEVGIWDISLTQSLIDDRYNAGSGYNPYADGFKVEAINVDTGSTINNFDVVMNTSLFYDLPTSFMYNDEWLVTDPATNMIDGNFNTYAERDGGGVTASGFLNYTVSNTHTAARLQVDRNTGGGIINSTPIDSCLSTTNWQFKVDVIDAPDYHKYRCWNGATFYSFYPPDAGVFKIYEVDLYGLSRYDVSSVLGQYVFDLNKTDTIIDQVTLTNELYYFNETYLFWNPAVNLTANLTPYFNISVDYFNYTIYQGINYTRALSFNVSYHCPSFINTTVLQLYIGGNAAYPFPLVCNDSLNIHSGYYQHTVEGSYPAYFLLSSTYEPEFFNKNYSFTNMTWDLNNPTAIVNFSVFGGFQNNTVNVSLNCEDSIMSTINYNLSYFDDQILFANYSNGSTQYNTSNIINGTNWAYGVCSDLFGSGVQNHTQDIYYKVLALIDEVDNIAFDVSNLSSARVYYDDNSSFYDFKTNSTHIVNFTAGDDVKLRFELGYDDGTIITRWVDVSLIDEDIRVCANKQGVTHYEQLITSAGKKKVIMRNLFSDCVVAADYTRFAYQNALVLKAYTIDSSYYLYTWISGVKAILASVDGSISTYINLDSLELNQKDVEASILTDVITYEKISDSTIKIMYLNAANDSVATEMTITNLNTSGVVYTGIETDEPNKFVVFFDYSTLNISNTTLFKIVACKTDSIGTETCISHYMDTNASHSVIPAGLAMVIAILLTIFGLTLANSSTTFSWFGIVITLACIAVLSFAPKEWYIIFMMGIEFIITIFIVINMVQLHNKEIAG